MPDSEFTFSRIATISHDLKQLKGVYVNIYISIQMPDYEFTFSLDSLQYAYGKSPCFCQMKKELFPLFKSMPACHFLL